MRGDKGTTIGQDRVMDDQWAEIVTYWFDEKSVVLLLYSSISF